jgi:muconolactone delta-isomerase
MQFLVRFDVHQPVDMSADELISIWNEEAKAALGAVDAGAITGIWKVAGQRTVFALCEFPDGRALDQALAGLPIVQEMGGSVDTEALPVYPYQDFAEDLRQAAEGG